jgi:hypothetical protein
MEKSHSLIAGHLRRRWGLSDDDVDIQKLAKSLERAIKACDTGHHGRLIPSPDGSRMTAEDLVHEFQLEKFLQKN